MLKSRCRIRWEYGKLVAVKEHYSDSNAMPVAQARISVFAAACAFFCCAFAFLDCAFAGPDLANPALNPVTPMSAPQHPPVTLVKDGAPQFVVAWDREAEKSAPPGLVNRPIREAVRTLRREIGFCTGNEIQEVDVSRLDPAPGRAVILVGRSPLTDALGIDPAKLPPEGFVVTTFSNGVAIVGNDSSLKPEKDLVGPRRATLWGAYDFLERVFGCRYYYPGPDGSVRPSCTNVVLAPFAYRDAPRFKNRCGNFSPGLATAVRTVGAPLVRASISDWRAASRLARTVEFESMHSPNPAKWAEAHPDLIDVSFFRSHDGHLYHSPTNHYANYYDVTNLKFADALAENLAAADTPEGRARQGFKYNVGRNVVFGQCDSFRSLDEMRSNSVVRSEVLITDANIALGQYGYFSDVYARFYQRFAERVNELLPGRTIIFMPYAGCTYAPTQKRFSRLPDNVELGVCLPKVPRFIRNRKVRDLMVRELHRWTEVLGGRPVKQLWTYNSYNGIFEQAVANEFLPEMIGAFGKDLGDVGLNIELNPYPLSVEGYCVPFHFYYETYCAFRALWGGERFNPDAALDEHWTLFYGADAGAHLGKLHHILKDAVLAHSVPETKVRALYPVETLDRIEAELVAARRILERDKSAPEWRRFKMMSYPLEYELDMQRRRHAATEPEKPLRVHFIAGQEGPP